MGNEPSTVITAGLLFILAAFHPLRPITNFDLAVAGHSVPLWVGIATVPVVGLLSWELFRDARGRGWRTRQGRTLT